MKLFLTLCLIGLFYNNIHGQLVPPKRAGNKEKLAQMDSLLRVMTKKKDQLADLLTDFTNVSKELEKSKDTSIKGRTINERLRSVEKNAKQRKLVTENQNVPAALTRLEQITAAIKKNYNEIGEIAQDLKDKKESLSEMNEMDMLMLQQMMDKKTQLETLISNVMKAGYEGGQAAIQALKAS